MGKELYVGSISSKATEDDLRKLFSVAGTVGAIHLITDFHTGEFKCCGYVKMADDKEAKEAIETLDGALLIDRVITVSEARPRTQRGAVGGANAKVRPAAGSRPRPGAGSRKGRK